MKPTSSVRLILLLVVSSTFLVNQGMAYCTLCATARDLPKRWAYQFEDGRRCADIYAGLSEISSMDPQCQIDKNLAQDICCNDLDAPTGAPIYDGEPGNEPVCSLCGTDEYPDSPGTYLTIRYLGTYTCGQLYNRGRYGLIPEYLCGALQDFAYDLCGCDGGDLCDDIPMDTDFPTAEPTRQPIMSTSEPTLTPSVHITPYPTVAITPRPTEDTDSPTLLPTKKPTGFATMSPTETPFRTTLEPTTKLTDSPTGQPTKRKATSDPTRALAEPPTKVPVAKPTDAPTKKEIDTDSPTTSPTKPHTMVPETAPPTNSPTSSTTPVPTDGDMTKTPEPTKATKKTGKEPKKR